MTPTEFETATFRFVAQCLIQVRHRLTDQRKEKLWIIILEMCGYKTVSALYIDSHLPEDDICGQKHLRIISYIHSCFIFIVVQLLE
jgi:hypothetical protein